MVAPISSRTSSISRLAGDQLVLAGHVDPVEARRDDRRRGDAHVHLDRAGLEEHGHDLARGRAAHDRVVHDHDALPAHFAERVELHPHAAVAEHLVRLDEGAADVAVLDQPLLERDAALAGKADRRGRSRVRDGHDQVGLDGRFHREPLAHPHPRAVQLDAAKRRVGPREVDELEDAERAAVAAARPPAPCARRSRRRRRARRAAAPGPLRLRSGRTHSLRTRARNRPRAARGRAA